MENNRATINNNFTRYDAKFSKIYDISVNVIEFRLQINAVYTHFAAGWLHQCPREYINSAVVRVTPEMSCGERETQSLGSYGEIYYFHCESLPYIFRSFFFFIPLRRYIVF